MAEQTEYPSIKYDNAFKEQQVKDVSGHLGISIVSPTLANGELEHSWDTLKKLFPERHEEYLRSLRELGKQRRGVETSRQEILQQRAKVLQLNLADYITHHHAENEVDHRLMPHQMEVFTAIKESLEKGERKGYVKLPTGTGKTAIFCEFMEAAGMKTLIVVPSQVLVDQTGGEVERFATDLDIGKIYAEAKKHGEDVTITTYHSLVNKVKSGELQPEEYGLLILDEAHRSLSEARMEAVQAFTESVQLGFTATPNFNEKKKVSNLLPHEIKSMSIEEAANREIIAPFLPMIVETSLDLSTVSVQNGEYNQKELEKAVNTHGRNLAAVQVYKTLPELRDQTAVAYCVGVDHATSLAKEFQEQGVSAAVISGQTSSNDRKEILKKYKSGEIKVLCNADLLIEGFNEPRASVCLNLRPTKSIVIAEQRGGRVLRLDKDNPNKFAYIVDFLDEDTSEKRSPVLFTDIVNMEEIKLQNTSRAAVKNPDAEEEEVPTQIEIDGLKVTINVSLEDVLGITNRKNTPKEKPEEEKEVEKVIPWYTWEQAKEEYCLTDDESKVLVDHVAAWRPQWVREEKLENGETITQYRPEALERACSRRVINELLDNLNDHVPQNRVISIPIIKVFMEVKISSNPELVKEFMQFLSSEDYKNEQGISEKIAKLENTRFIQNLRDFMLEHMKNLNTPRFLEAGIEARKLAA